MYKKVLKLSIYPFRLGTGNLGNSISTLRIRPSLTVGWRWYQIIADLGSTGGQAMYELILFITDFEIFLF